MRKYSRREIEQRVEQLHDHIDEGVGVEIDLTRHSAAPLLEELNPEDPTVSYGSLGHLERVKIEPPAWMVAIDDEACRHLSIRPAGLTAAQHEMLERFCDPSPSDLAAREHSDPYPVECVLSETTAQRLETELSALVDGSVTDWFWCMSISRSSAPVTARIARSGRREPKLSSSTEAVLDQIAEGGA